MRRAVTATLLKGASKGSAARALAVRLEALRTVGPRMALRRIGQEVRLDRLGRPNVRAGGYAAIWQDAAETLDANVEAIGDGFLRIRRGDAATIVHGQQVMLDDAVTIKVADDKIVAHELLASRQVSVASRLAFKATDISAALAFLGRWTPCVVKPARHTGGGQGTSGGIRTPTDLMRAVLKAWRWSDDLLVEHQVPGCVYRLLYLDGELLDTVSRRPPSLVGDGASTVGELIGRENERRLHERSFVGSLLRLDLDAVLTLREQALTPHSVPPRGLTFDVKSITSQNARLDNATHRGPLSPEIVDHGRLAVEALGLRLAGVDLITTDPSRPLAKTGGVIIEVNSEPGLQHHYEVDDRSGATRVAVPILQRLLEGGL